MIFRKVEDEGDTKLSQNQRTPWKLGHLLAPTNHENKLQVQVGVMKKKRPNLFRIGLFGSGGRVLTAVATLHRVFELAF